MNQELIKKIKKEYPQYSNTNKVIADVILKNKKKQLNLTIQEFANKAYCVPSTVYKFIKLVGYSSYRVFMNDLNKAQEFVSDHITESFALVNEYINNNERTFNQLSADLLKHENTYLFATGQSCGPTLDFYKKISKLTDNTIFFSTNVSTLKKLSENIKKNDLVIIVSNSGTSREVTSIMRNMKIKDSYLITNRENSKISHLVTNSIVLNNHFEENTQFSEYPIGSKYTINYFLDKVFMNAFIEKEK